MGSWLLGFAGAFGWPSGTLFGLVNDHFAGRLSLLWGSSMVRGLRFLPFADVGKCPRSIGSTRLIAVAAQTGPISIRQIKLLRGHAVRSQN